MRRALVWAIVGLLLVPAALRAAGDPPTAAAPGDGTAAATPEMTPATTAQAPAAALAIAPRQPVAGEPVRLDASGSTGAIAAYRWDLDGDGSFETAGGTEPVLEHAFDAGPVTVGVQVADASGATDEATADLTVSAPAPDPEPQATKPPEPAAPAKPAKAPQPAKPAEASPASRYGEPPAQLRRARKVHAAASSSVTIQNFAFSPATINVNQGDTITWTNRDSAPHTATGSGGSFNTGTLQEGDSGSATFSKAGTFSYFCSVHPSMKGTVVVAAAGGSGGSG
ncbi:MAG: hypothetical protein QOG63_577, partial [Thermoleophilaceae bacterium]|nr:hypothetical protein [Thermoleophilaceae bacterium]